MLTRWNFQLQPLFFSCNKVCQKLNPFNRKRELIFRLLTRHVGFVTLLLGMTFPITFIFFIMLGILGSFKQFSGNISFSRFAGRYLQVK